MIYTSKTLNQIMNTMNNGTTLDDSNVSLRMVDPISEPIIQIESDLRTINVPNELRKIAVTGDHLSETIYFSCPKYFDGQDLSQHNCIIRFVNAGNEYGESQTTDLEIGDNTIKFGWKIDNHVTRYSGNIYFTVQFETVSDRIEYQWQTTPAELYVLPGLNIEEALTDKDDILFRSLTRRISILEDKFSQFEIVIQDVKTLQEQVDILQNDVGYLHKNAAYITLDE